MTALRPRTVAALLTLCPTLASAQNLVRAPYLQSATPSSMVVVWTTDASVAGEVRWGTDPSALTEVASDGAGLRHAVKLSGLAPDTRYYYSVGAPGKVLAGGDAAHTFLTLPAAGTKKKVRAWVVGDSGTGGSEQAAVHAAMLAFGGKHYLPSLFLHMGDIAYDSGTETEFTQHFFGMYAPTLARMPLFPTLGNHEGASASSATQTGPYYDAFVLPKGGESGGVPSGTEAYYSFDVGNAHFVVLDSQDSPKSPTGAMATWLKSDLLAAKQPWLIAYWHHPPYSKGTHDSDTEGSLISMRENFLPILEAAGVDLVLAGHSHIYERSYLIDGAYGTPTTATGKIKDAGDGLPLGKGPYKKPSSTTANAGAVYVVAGHGGAGVGKAGNHPVMFFSEPAYGSCILDLQDNRLSMLNVRSTGAVTDRFTIVKGDAIVVAAPDGGETLAGGSSFDIAWSTVGSAPTVDLELSLDDGKSWQSIAKGVANTGKYAWTVPAADTEQGLVRVKSSSGSLEDESNAGFRIASSAPQVAVPLGAEWSYDDSDTDHGTAWKDPGFSDAGWKKGKAQLGYGDGDEATVLAKGTPTSPSYYFRKHVTIAGAVSQASLSVLHDDGVAVFVNGTQVFQKYVGGLAHDALATAQSAENEVSKATLDTAPFVSGDNVIAAVVKQSSATSSDVSFDLELTLTAKSGGAGAGGSAGAGGGSAGSAGGAGKGGGAGGASGGAGGASGGAAGSSGGAAGASGGAAGASGGAGGGGAAKAGGGGQAGTQGAAASAGQTGSPASPDDASSDDAGGCGCGVARPPSMRATVLGLLLASAGVLRRRRRRG